MWTIEKDPRERDLNLRTHKALYTIKSEMHLNARKHEVIHTHEHTLSIQMHNNRVYSQITTYKKALWFLWIVL